MEAEEGNAEDATERPQLDTGEEEVLDYADKVAKCVEQACGRHRQVEKWVQECSPHESLKEHISAVFEAKSGVLDFASRRLERVQAALEMQREMQKEKKLRKSDRMVKISARAVMQSYDNPGAEKMNWNAAASAMAAAAFVEVAELNTSWVEVNAFKTLKEALGFVIECQPFDYRPAGQLGESYPRFQNSRESLAHVLKMDPVPDEFVSIETMFRRRLRVRRAKPGETKEEIASKLAQRKHRAIIGRKQRETVTSTTGPEGQILEPKCWIVEAAGSLFERPPSLRALQDGLRYYVAVSPEVEKKVLAEGFKVKRRSSIPASGTPQEALAAFARSELRREEAALPLRGATSGKQEKEHKGPRATVLAVALTADMGIDVVAHRNGGFHIRSQYLPASCFARLRKVQEAGS